MTDQQAAAEPRRQSNRPGAQHAPPVDFKAWRERTFESLREGGPGHMFKAILILVLMVLGSALLWIGMPVFWLWLASQLQQGVNPSLGPFAVVAIGLPISMVAIGKGLGALDRRFSKLIGFDPNDRRVPLPWQRQMADSGGARKGTFLDLVMIVSVLLAGLAFGIWFFLFAGSSLPGA
jgi:hypothetical protein